MVCGGEDGGCAYEVENFNGQVFKRERELCFCDCGWLKRGICGDDRLCADVGISFRCFVVATVSSFRPRPKKDLSRV